MISLFQITSLHQGKLNNKPEAALAEAMARHDGLMQVVRFTALRRLLSQTGAALAAAWKLLNEAHAKIHTAH